MKTLYTLALAALMVTSAVAQTAAPADGSIEQQVRQLALDGTRNVGAGNAATRVEIEVGQLDPRLHPAPCQKVQPYLPVGTRLWGKARIGLRCVQGPSPWNVFMPITVKVWSLALVAAVPLPVGSVLTQADLAQAEVDLTESSTPAVADLSQAIGRTLTRALNPGDSVRSGFLKQRQLFAAGDMVRVTSNGEGFSITSEGVAITAGLEGQQARIRTDSGRVLSGVPSGDRQMETTP